MTVGGPAGEFLNVDLDIEAPSDLTPLLRYLESRGAHVLRAECAECVSVLSVELGSPENPESALRAFVDMVHQMPPEMRQMWNGAAVRRFDVGIQANNGRSHYEITAAVLGDVSAAGASLVLTVYGSE